MSRPFLFATPVASALSASGIFIADSVVKGVLLLTMASIVAWVLRRDSAATRHWVWLMAIVSLLLIPWMSVVLPQWRVLPAWMTLEALGSQPANAIEELLSENLGLPGASAADHFENSKLLRDEPPTLTKTSPVMDDGQNNVVVNTTFPTELAVEALPSRQWNWPTALSLCWMIGFLLCWLRLMIARSLLWRTERNAIVLCNFRRTGLQARSQADADLDGPGDPSYAPSYILSALTEARTQLGIKQRVKLLLHPHKTIPVVWGILRPRLLLPAIAGQWSEEQLRSVLLHELAHIKRRDALSQLLAQTACALHWFNPLVWLAVWRLHVERERACDDLVLASGVRASAYAEHLLDVATRLTSSPWMQACGLAMARSSSLHGRITAVLVELFFVL